MLFILWFLSLFSFVDFGVMPVGVGLAPFLIWTIINVKFSIINIFIIIFFIVSQVVLTQLNGCGDHILKNSLASATFILIISIIIQRSTVRYSAFQNEVTVYYTLTFSAILILISLIFDLFQTNFTVRPSGWFFHEPSHTNFVLVPLFIYAILERRIIMAFIVAVSLALAFSSSGLVSLAISIAIIKYHIFMNFFKLKISRKMVYAIPVVVGFLAFVINNDMFMSRLEGVFGVQSDLQHRNLSSLVYINGYLQALEYFKETFGLGVGIANMGCEGGVETGVSIFIIQQTGGVYLNYNDGSFLFSKLVSELGIIGVILLLYIALGLLTEIKFQYREKLKICLQSAHNLALSFTVPSVVYIFLRGAGYFDFNFVVLLLFFPMFSYIRGLQSS